MSDAPMELRASRMPLAFKCAESIRRPPGELFVSSDSEAGTLGTAVHDALAQHVMGVDTDLADYAAKWNVDEQALAPLFFFGVSAWNDLKATLLTPKVELELEAVVAGHVITGHADVVYDAGQSVYIIDWKSGQVQRDYTTQLLTYALAAARQFQQADKFSVVTVWLRDKFYETKTVTRDELDQFANRIAHDVLGKAGRYVAGDHCGFCPRFSGCPGRGQVALAIIRELDDGGYLPAPGTPATHPIAGTVLASALARIRYVENVCEQARKTIREWVKAAGHVDTKPGYALQIKTEIHEVISAKRAWPVFLKYLDEDGVNACLKVGKTELLKRVSEGAERGQKGKLKAAVLDELRELGAVSETTVEKLVELPYDEGVE